MRPVAEAYAELGITEGCSADEVKRAYRRAIDRVRAQDGGSNTDAERAAQVRRLNEAVFVVGQTLTQSAVQSTAKGVQPMTSAELDELLPPPAGKPSDVLDPVVAALLASAGALLLGRSAPPEYVPSAVQVGAGGFALGMAGFYGFRFAWRRRAGRRTRG